MKLRFLRDYRHPTWGLFLPGVHQVDDDFANELLKSRPNLVEKVEKKKAPENKQKKSKTQTK